MKKTWLLLVTFNLSFLMALLLIKNLCCFGCRLDGYEKLANQCSNSEKKPAVRSDMDNLNLGIKLDGGKMHVLIPKNSKIPRKVEGNLILTNDFESVADIDVYEGESSMAEDNVWLGVIKMEGLPPAPKGITNVKICFHIDVNGTLKVSVQDKISSELNQEITITNDQRQCAKMLKAKKTFKDFTNGVKRTICDPGYGGKLKALDKKMILYAANDAIEWLNKNPSAKVYEYEDKQKELEVLWTPVITGLFKDAARQSSSSWLSVRAS